MLFLVVQCMRLHHLLREHKHRMLDHHHLATTQLKLASGECECTKLVYTDSLDRGKGRCTYMYMYIVVSYTTKYCHILMCCA